MSANISTQGNPADLLNVRPTTNGHEEASQATDEAVPVLREQEVGDRQLGGVVQHMRREGTAVSSIPRLETAYPVEPPLDPREVSILTEAASLLRRRNCHASAAIVMEELNWLAGRLNPNPKSREPVDKDRQTWDAVERVRREKRLKRAACTTSPVTFDPPIDLTPELGGES